jgi:hypothetical protein
VAGPPGPIQVAQPDAIRARDQHILYLQYEISQRDIQMQQLVEQAQQVSQASFSNRRLID